MPDEDYATVFLVDMTTRHQAEQRLAEQHTFYETILNQVKVAVAVVDPDYRLMYANELAEPDPAARAVAIGLTVEEQGRQRQRAPEVLQRRQRYLEQARREGPVSWEETFADGPQQRSLLVNIAPVRGAAGELRYFIISSVDITARKQAEEQVARQREFYEGILDSLAIEVVAFDAGQRFLFANPAAVPNPRLRQRLPGMSRAEFSRLQRRPAAQLAERERQFELAVSSRQEVRWEENDPAPHGERRILRSLRAVFDADAPPAWWWAPASTSPTATSPRSCSGKARPSCASSSALCA